MASSTKVTIFHKFLSTISRKLHKLTLTPLILTKEFSKVNMQYVAFKSKTQVTHKLNLATGIQLEPSCLMPISANR